MKKQRKKKIQVLPPSPQQQLEKEEKGSQSHGCFDRCLPKDRQSVQNQNPGCLILQKKTPVVVIAHILDSLQL